MQGVDDFASIREVVTRRFRRLQAEGEASGEDVFPDILLIDGGKGQLNAALEAFGVLGIEPPCLISLAILISGRPNSSSSVMLATKPVIVMWPIFRPGLGSFP